MKDKDIQPDDFSNKEKDIQITGQGETVSNDSKINRIDISGSDNRIIKSKDIESNENDSIDYTLNELSKVSEMVNKNSSILSKILNVVKLNDERNRYKDESILRMQKQLTEYEKDIKKSIKETLIKDIILFYDSLTGFYEKYKYQLKSIDGCNSEFELLVDELLELLFCQNIELIDIDIDQNYNRNYQKVVRTEPTMNTQENEKVVKKIRDGFKWDEKVLRKQEIVVKKFK